MKYILIIKTFHFIEQQLKSGKIRIIKNNVSRPVDWVFYLTWHDDGDSADLAIKSAGEKSLDSVAFVISKTGISILCRN